MSRPENGARHVPGTCSRRRTGDAGPGHDGAISPERRSSRVRDARRATRARTGGHGWRARPARRRPEAQAGVRCGLDSQRSRPSEGGESGGRSGLVRAVAEVPRRFQGRLDGPGIREAPGLWYAKGLAHLGLLESTLAIRSFERALALDPTLKEAKAALRRATALREKSDFYRGAYECFGTHLAGDPGCEECEIRPRCREVTP